MRGPWQGPLGPPSHDPTGDCPSPAPCSNLSWLSYGTLKGDGTLIVVNAVGAALQTLYISAYVHYCPRKVDALPCTTPPSAAGRALLAGQTLLPGRPTGWHCHLFLEGRSSRAVLPPGNRPETLTSPSSGKAGSSAQPGGALLPSKLPGRAFVSIVPPEPGPPALLPCSIRQAFIKLLLCIPRSQKGILPFLSNLLYCG